MTVSLDPNITLVFIAVINLIGLAVTAYVTIKTTKSTNEAVLKQGLEQLKVSDTITKLEVNTNSMSDKLNLVTASSALAQGRAEGIASERANPQVSASVIPEVPPLPPVPPLPITTSAPPPAAGQPVKQVSAMNVRIIPDQVIPVKETK